MFRSRSPSCPARRCRSSASTISRNVACRPNLTIADASITTNVYMRGIGSGLDRGFEQSVGLFVDGIYMGRSKQYRAPMFDVDRVEVLRGPQPVLFGKNTTAGAIKIETRKPAPGDRVSADISAEYENKFNGRQMSGVVSGSPTETTGLRLAALYSETDGFARNTFRNVDEPGIEPMGRAHHWCLGAFRRILGHCQVRARGLQV